MQVYDAEFTPIVDIVVFRDIYDKANHRAYTTNNTSTEYRAWGICPSYATKVNHGPNKVSCSVQVVYYNNGAFPTYYDTTNERKAIFCHETGHTLGLRHSSETGSCMKLVPGTVRVLTGHDDSMLTNLYPLP